MYFENSLSKNLVFSLRLIFFFFFLREKLKGQFKKKKGKGGGVVCVCAPVRNASNYYSLEITVPL